MACRRLSEMPDVFAPSDAEKLFSLVMEVDVYRQWQESSGDICLSGSDQLRSVTEAVGLECARNDAACSPLVEKIIALMQPRLAAPRYCAGVLCAQSFWKAFLTQHLGDARRAIAEASGEPHSRRTDGKIQDLRMMCKMAEALWQPYELFLSWLGVADRHPLYATNYSLLLPSTARVRISEPIEQMIVESARNPSLIYRMGSRDFERYIARIWEAFGFQVNLTARSRDGGVDIVCMSSCLDVPLMIAIQAKRHSAHRPVSVELIRGFVGANAIIGANKLVYVTTSRYTKDAMDYAASPTLTNLLDLRGLPDILRWAQQFERHRSIGSIAIR